MVYNNSCKVHSRNEFCAGHCRDNSHSGVSRDDCAGVSRNDSRARDSRNESRADDDSRNEPSTFVDSRNGLCVQVDFQRDETFLDVCKDDVTFLDVQTDGVTLPVPCSSSSFSLGSVVVVGPRESVCSDMKLESDGGTDDSTSEPLAKSAEMKRLVGIAVCQWYSHPCCVQGREEAYGNRCSSTEGTGRGSLVLDSFLNQVKVEQQPQPGQKKRVLTPSAKAAKHRRAKDKKLQETLCWWRAIRQESEQLNVQMSHQHTVLGWRIQPVPLVGQELMIQDTGFPPQLWKMRKTCGPEGILRCYGSSKSTITSGRTMGSLLVCAKKSGMSFSAIPVKTVRTARLTCVTP